MSYLEELLPEFRKGGRIKRKVWAYSININECIGIPLSMENIKADDWELAIEPEIDWDYIIQNKCLCWFWDEKEEYKIAGYLKEVNSNKILKFFRNDIFGESIVGFKNCRPVRRDEVTFYEDREDD